MKETTDQLDLVRPYVVGRFQLDNHIINNITITAPIARKLRLTLVIEEHFEFTIRAAKNSEDIRMCAQLISNMCDFRETSAIQPPYNRHTTAIVSKYRYISTGIYTIFAI